jgi:hypothetical protein
MKLFAVHMNLVVTCKRLRGIGGTHEVPDSRKLAVIAEDAAQAGARAIGWLEDHSHTADRRRIEFHQGHFSDILAVRLAASSELAIYVVEAEQGVVRL